MQGMELDTPKGKMILRKEDHQALQSMYAFNINPNVVWGIPELTRELKIEHRDVPIDSDDAVVGDAGLDHPFRRTDRG
jgi:branched-chain amino acid transport system substrate-binding protein